MTRKNANTSTLWKTSTPIAPAPMPAGAPSRSEGPRGWVAGPPRLVGGANRQGDHTSYRRPDESVCIDWLSYTGPSSEVERVRDFLSEQCGLGDPDPDNTKGGKFYSRGYHWGHIALLYKPEDRGMGHFLLQIPGSGCTAIRETRRLSDLCRYLHEHGCKPTRVDIAVDFYSRDGGGSVDLVQKVLAACHAGELVGTRTFTPGGGFKLKAGECIPEGRSVSLGRRGRLGSGRYVVVYEKGLESGTCGPGQWHRWEARFSQASAAMLVGALIVDTGETHLRALALGAMDFLDRPGARRRDRQRASWWAAIIDGQEVRTVRPRRVRSTLDGVRHWIDTGVAGTLKTYALASGKNLAELVAELIGKDPEPTKSAAGSQGFRDWCRHLGIPYWEGLRRAGLEAWTKAHGVERRMYAELAERFAASAAHPDLVMATSRRRLT